MSAMGGHRTYESLLADDWIAPMAAVQTSVTVFPKRSFIGAIAKGWVRWTAVFSRS